MNWEPPATVDEAKCLLVRCVKIGVIFLQDWRYLNDDHVMEMAYSLWLVIHLDMKEAKKARQEGRLH